MAQSPLNLSPAGFTTSITESILSNAYPTSSATSHSYLQEWITDESGRKYPVVDNKYFDGKTGQVVTLGPDDIWSTTGPPSLEVYWQNLGSASSDKDKGVFCGAFKSSPLTMTEYVTQVGGFLKDCNCKLRSLTATTYSVNIVFYADLSREDMWFLWRKYGL